MMLSYEDGSISKMTYKPSKPGQTDLVFGLRSAFISQFVHAWLQVSTFMIRKTLVNTRTHTDTISSASWWRKTNLVLSLCHGASVNRGLNWSHRAS